MIPKPSPLEIHDFAITQLDYKFIPPESESENIANYFKKYELNIDFGVLSNDYLMVYVKAEVNKGESTLPGYSLSAEATCIFQFNPNDSTLNDQAKENLEGFSTIYIALNCLRGLVSNLTANAPFGRYILPSIDLNDLIEKKKKEMSPSVDKKPKAKQKKTPKIKSSKTEKS